MKRSIRVDINLSDKVIYGLGLIVIFILAGVGVYALSPGVSPSPGHIISDIAPPVSCADGQVLQFVNESTGWGCVDLSSSTGSLDNCQVCIQCKWEGLLKTEQCATLNAGWSDFVGPWNGDDNDPAYCRLSFSCP